MFAIDIYFSAEPLWSKLLMTLLVYSVPVKKRPDSQHRFRRWVKILILKMSIGLRKLIIKSFAERDSRIELGEKNTKVCEKTWKTKPLLVSKSHSLSSLEKCHPKDCRPDLTLFDMGFFSTVSHRGGGGGHEGPPS